MRRIIVNIQNGLLGEALTKLLENSGEFEPYRIMVDESSRLPQACVAFRPDIVLMEVTWVPGTALDTRLQEGKQIRHLLPDCKIVLLCDEKVSPEIARNVIEAKRSGDIDAFYYSSLTGKYLLAALYAL